MLWRFAKIGNILCISVTLAQKTTFFCLHVPWPSGSIRLLHHHAGFIFTLETNRKLFTSINIFVFGLSFVCIELLCTLCVIY